MADLATPLQAVVGVFEAQGTAYVVAGSVAAAAWGVARTTRDVDIVAVTSTDEIEALLAALDPTEFYVPSDEARRVARSGGSFNVLHLHSGGKVDVFVERADDPFTVSRMTRRVRGTVLGVDVWVSTPEDIVLAKLAWRRESRSDVQWRDCVEIVATNAVDVGYLRRWAPELGVRDDLEELLTSAGR